MKRPRMPLLLAAACLSASTLRAADRPAPAVVVEVRSIRDALRELDTVSIGIGAKPASAAVEALLARATGATALVGVESNRPLRVCLMLPSGADEDFRRAAPPVVVITPVSGNGKAYLEAVGTRYGAREQTGGLQQYSQPVEGSGAEGTLYVAMAGDSAVSGPSAEHVRQIAQALKAQPGADLIPMRGLPGTLRVAVDVAACLPLVEQSMAQTRQAMGGMTNRTSAGGVSVEPAKIMDVEMNVLLNLMRQLNTLTIGITGRSQAVEICSRLTPKPGSTYAGILARRQPIKTADLALLPRDALLAAAGNGMQMMDDLAEPYAEFMESLYAAMGVKGTGKAMADIMKSMKGLYTGNYAIGVVPAGKGATGLALVEVFAVKDGAKALSVATNAMSRYSREMAELSPLRMQLGRPRLSGSTAVVPWGYTAVTNQEPAGPAAAALPILGKMSGELSATGNYLVYTMGPAWAMDQALARLKNPAAAGTAPAVLETILADMKEQPTSVFAVSLTRTLKAVLGQVMGSPQAAATIPDSRGVMGGYSFRQAGDLFSLLRVSTSEIASLRGAGPVLAASIMTGMMRGGAQGDAAGGQNLESSETARCTHNLRMLDAAKEQCALERTLANGATLKERDVTAYLKGNAMPLCPSGGTYTLAPVGEPPRCSIPEHVLP